jgi:hypothetical protein
MLIAFVLIVIGTVFSWAGHKLWYSGSGIVAKSVALFYGVVATALVAGIAVLWWFAVAQGTDSVEVVLRQPFLFRIALPIAAGLWPIPMLLGRIAYQAAKALADRKPRRS